MTCRTLHPLWLFAGPGNRCLGIRNGGYDNNSKRFYSFKSRRTSCNLYKKQTGLIISVSHSTQRSTRYHSDALLHITCVFLTKRNKTLGLRKKAQLNKHAAMKQVKRLSKAQTEVKSTTKSFRVALTSQQGNKSFLTTRRVGKESITAGRVH